jgi:hypothetical protein
VVEAALADRPHLRQAVGDFIGGQRSDAFPHARRSPRQIARILGATQRCTHLLRLVDDLERCLALGLKLRWLSTVSHTQLRSGLAEVRVADELARDGFDIDDLDDGKSQERVPEFVARRGDIEVGVEVYAPRQSQRLEDLTDDLADYLRHLDRPYDYSIELDVGPSSRLNADSSLASMHPGPVDTGLDDAPVRNAIVTSVIDAIDTTLTHGRPIARATQTVESLNLKVDVALTNIRRAAGAFPQRPQLIGRWPSGGYAPEGIFDHLARGRLRRKLQRGQAPAAAATSSLLVVDLTAVGVSDEAR